MTNEKLAVEIRDGNEAFLPELWLAVSKFIAQQAGLFFARNKDFFISSVCEVDDLIQSGYFAMLQAVATFDETKGAFLTWLGQHLQNAFREAALLRTERQKHQSAAEAAAVRLDETISIGDDDICLADMLPDPSVKVEDEAIDATFTEALHQRLVAYINSTLEPESADLILKRYFEEMSTVAIAQSLSVDSSTIRKDIKKSIAKLHHGLRYTSAGAQLERFIDDAIPIRRISLRKFQTTGVSEVEQAVFKREAMRNMLKRKGPESAEIYPKIKTEDFCNGQTQKSQ